MAEITWIKLKTDMFDSTKIRLIEKLPEGDTILVIWIKLLTAAGKANCNGYIMLTENIPMNIEEMATIFDRPLNTVRLAMEAFKRYGMVEVDENDVVCISNWEKHQNIDGMDKIREQNRLRKQKEREKKKNILISKPNESHVTVTENHAIELELELEEEKKVIKDIVGDESPTKVNQNKMPDEMINMILTYFNQKMNKTRGFSKTDSTTKLLNALYKAGHKDIGLYQYVIDNKYNEWINNEEMKKYLVPGTLFNKQKFEKYIEQDEISLTPAQSNNNKQAKPWEVSAYGQTTSWNVNDNDRGSIPKQHQIEQRTINI